MTRQTPTIHYETALRQQVRGRTIILDVREPAEFREGHLPGAINLPMSVFREQDFAQWKGRQVTLVCQTGSRARDASRLLRQAGVADITLLDRHMEQLELPIAPQGTWTIDRQFRLTLGLLLLISLTGYALMSNWFLVIPVILCLGLIITAIIDKCYLRVGIAMLPWNRGREE